MLRPLALQPLPARSESDCESWQAGSGACAASQEIATDENLVGWGRGISILHKEAQQTIACLLVGC